VRGRHSAEVGNDRGNAGGVAPLAVVDLRRRHTITRPRPRREVRPCCEHGDELLKKDTGTRGLGESGRRQVKT
jgi:hypothetical protein